MLLEMATEGDKDSGIGTYRESTIHEQLKKMYSTPGSTNEVAIDGYIVDVLQKSGKIVEIQTGSFRKIRKKLQTLLESHTVRLVYPLPATKTLVVCDGDGVTELYRRKSTVKRSLIDIVDELVGIATILSMRRLEIEILYANVEEVRSRDGKGSWRRKGISIIDKRLKEITGRTLFRRAKDLLSLLPTDIPDRFTNKNLALLLHTAYDKAQKLTYCLRECGLIEKVGKHGREYEYSAKPSASHTNKRS